MHFGTRAAARSVEIGGETRPLHSKPSGGYRSVLTLARHFTMKKNSATNQIVLPIENCDPPN